MDIQGKNILVLGASGLVGTAICRKLLSQQPACLVVVSRRKHKALETAQQLRTASPDNSTRILPVWGEAFLRAEWQRDEIQPSYFGSNLIKLHDD
jgi:NAD(P)-dependent dehydrogenase (short-subunit alcohol dehydrogenase family)